MKGTDRFLIAIVAGALLIAGAAAASTLLHRSTPAYRPDDTPEGVAYNYVLALQQDDYTRAYGYLSSTIPGYPPSVAAFAGDLGPQSRYDQDRNASLATDPARPTGDLATVLIRETSFYSGGLFDSGERTNTYNVMLKRENAGWRIISSDRFWSGKWQR